MMKHQQYIWIFLIITFLISGCSQKTVYKPYEKTVKMLPCHNEEDLKKPEYEKFTNNHIASPDNIEILIDNLTKMKNHNDNLIAIINCYDLRLKELNK